MKKLVRKWWFWLVVVLVIGGVGSGANDNGDKPAATQVQVQEQPAQKEAKPEVEKKRFDPERYLATKEDFAKIEKGMTYREVADIIGWGGKASDVLISEAGEKGTEAYTAIYQFEGKGDIGANVVTAFQGGKLISKAQSGLE